VSLKCCQEEHLVITVAEESHVNTEIGQFSSIRGIFIVVFIVTVDN